MARFSCSIISGGNGLEAASILSFNSRTLREPQSESAILSYCREHLAEFKCPKKLYVVQTIPRTATGKIQRGAVASTLVEAKS